VLTLPPLTIHKPQSVAEALQLLGERQGARVLAGGTDLVPNLKYGMYETGELVALRGLSRELRYLREEASDQGEPELRLGALVTIDQVARDPAVRARFSALADAASQIAGPQLRRMGTLGGNLCLDTRCVYINQSHFWRQALGYCMKKDGTVCHVVQGGMRCVAAASNDTAPVLVALGASVLLASPRGRRQVLLEEFYLADGVKNTVLAPDELLVEARIPLSASRKLQAYQKLRMRQAIDFPALNLGVALSVEGGKLSAVKLCVGAIAARPAVIRNVEPLLGSEVGDGRALGAELGRRAQKQCKPLTNIGVDPHWRREVLPVLVRRAVMQAVARGSTA
jgi:4-hydroxybenzoyl-CoA reductase subunit beta